MPCLPSPPFVKVLYLGYPLEGRESRSDGGNLDEVDGFAVQIGHFLAGQLFQLGDAANGHHFQTIGGNPQRDRSAPVPVAGDGPGEAGRKELCLSS